MSLLLGCIADDFIGGTDLAGMLVPSGNVPTDEETAKNFPLLRNAPVSLLTDQQVEGRRPRCRIQPAPELKGVDGR